jgi:hypothetical protein
MTEMVQEHPEREIRLTRAANLVAVRQVDSDNGIGWLVGSESDASKTYWVQCVADVVSCDCQDYRQRGGPCKHALAVELLRRCERREVEESDPTLKNVTDFPEQPAYGPEDHFELTIIGDAYLNTMLGA